MTRGPEKRRVLLVEGRSDKHFVWHMLAPTAIGTKIRKTLSIEAKGGVTKTHRKFKDKKELRAKIYAWLATREAPGRIGAAIKEGDMETDGELATSFMRWITLLFDEAVAPPYDGSPARASSSGNP